MPSAPGRLAVLFVTSEAAPLVKTGMQIGVKEIRHEGWQHYGPLFPEMKVVLLGRDQLIRMT